MPFPMEDTNPGAATRMMERMKKIGQRTIPRKAGARVRRLYCESCCILLGFPCCCCWLFICLFVFFFFLKKRRRSFRNEGRFERDKPLFLGQVFFGYSFGILFTTPPGSPYLSRSSLLASIKASPEIRCFLKMAISSSSSSTRCAMR